MLPPQHRNSGSNTNGSMWSLGKQMSIGGEICREVSELRCQL